MRTTVITDVTAAALQIVSVGLLWIHAVGGQAHSDGAISGTFCGSRQALHFHPRRSVIGGARWTRGDIDTISRIRAKEHCVRRFLAVGLLSGVVHWARRDTLFGEPCDAGFRGSLGMPESRLLLAPTLVALGCPSHAGHAAAQLALDVRIEQFGTSYWGSFGRAMRRAPPLSGEYQGPCAWM